MFRRVSEEELKRLLDELEKWAAPATVLLSLYIPPNRPVGDVVGLLRRELSVAGNIKLKQTRRAVEYALSSAIARLTRVRRVPETGLVVFCGEDVASGNHVCYVFAPPKPVNIFFYRTDKRFHTEYLREILENSDVYGLLVVEYDAATIGLLRGNGIEVLEELEGYVPGKHEKGGQSQRRFQRLREQAIHEFYKRVAEYVAKHFLPLHEAGRLKGILVGGPGYAKEDFVSGEYLDYRLRRLVLRPLYSVSYQGWPGLRELVLRAEDVLAEQEFVEASRAVEEFKYHLARDDGLALYGCDEIRVALEYGAVKTLVIVDGVDDAIELAEHARQRGTRVIHVPRNHPDAKWLENTFGGTVAILRFKISINET